MAAKFVFKGTIVEWDSTGGTTWASLGDVRSVMPPQKKRRVANTTVSLSSQGYEEFIPHFKQGGQPKFGFRLHKTQYALLDTAFESDVIPNWRISFPLLSGESTPSRWVYLGIIETLAAPERSVDNDDPWDVECTIQITGQPVFTGGS
jgi:hypothetical protein